MKHAYWKRQLGKDPEAVCSACGREAVYQIVDGKWAFENFCPRCGARMDGKDNTCQSCKWYDDFTGACCNGESPYCADFTDSTHSCEFWEDSE